MNDREYVYLLDKAPFITIVHDTCGKITFANDFLCEITGLTRDDIIGTNWFTSYLTADSLWKMAQSYLNSQNQKIDYGIYEAEIITKIGEKRAINFLSIYLRGADDEIIGIVNIGEDIADGFAGTKGDR
ncbi:MAG: PAS domain S-box protein [Rubrobacteridae bacterium]|nr:PAS domain S-box protein [Rubrobacteridae bacterium]